MSRIQNISRRDFLKQTGATGALVLGAQIVPGSMVAAVRAQATGNVRGSPTCSSPSPTTAW